MERNKSAKIKNSAEKSSGEILPRDTEGNLMKSVAQTIIEADRFYTITAKTGSVIQAVESVKDGGNIRLGKYERKPEQEWAFVREGDGVYRIRNRASGKLIDLMMTGTANGTWLHLWEDVGGTSQMWKMEPTPPAPSACAPCGLPASASTPWAWVLRTALCSRSGRRLPARTSCGPSLR